MATQNDYQINAKLFKQSEEILLPVQGGALLRPYFDYWKQHKNKMSKKEFDAATRKMQAFPQECEKCQKKSCRTCQTGKNRLNPSTPKQKNALKTFQDVFIVFFTYDELLGESPGKIAPGVLDAMQEAYGDRRTSPEPTPVPKPKPPSFRWDDYRVVQTPPRVETPPPPPRREVRNNDRVVQPPVDPIPTPAPEQPSTQEELRASHLTAGFLSASLCTVSVGLFVLFLRCDILSLFKSTLALLGGITVIFHVTKHIVSIKPEDLSKYLGESLVYTIFVAILFRYTGTIWYVSFPLAILPFLISLNPFFVLRKDNFAPAFRFIFLVASLISLVILLIC